MANKAVYSAKLFKIVTGGGARNIDSYYIILRSSNNIKWISKTMRNDEDN